MKRCLIIGLMVCSFGAHPLASAAPPAKDRAAAQRAPGKKPTSGRAAPREATPRKPAPRKPAPRKSAPRKTAPRKKVAAAKATARKASSRKAAPRKAAPGKKAMSQAQLMSLLQDLRSASVTQKLRALRALQEYRGRAQVVLVSVARQMHHHNQAVRFSASRLLVRWGPDVLSYLRSALGHKVGKIRWTAAYTLAQLPTKDATIRSVLLNLLRDPFFRVRRHGIRGLSDRIPASSRVWEAIAALLQREPSPVNRIYCLKALVRDAAKAAPHLLRAIATDRHPVVKQVAARLAAGVKKPSPKLSGLLLERLAKETDEVVKLGLLRVWQGLHKRTLAKASKALPVLEKLFVASLWTLREAALETAGQLGPAASSLRAAIQQKTRDPRPEVRRAATLALGKLGPASPRK